MLVATARRLLGPRFLTMLRRFGVLFVLAVMFMTAGAAAAVGCSSPHPSTSEVGAEAPPAPAPGDTTGALGMQLSLPGGVHISQVSYTLTNGANTLSGSYRVSAASTLSFVIGSVPAGTGYSLFLVANSDDGSITCSYPAAGDPNVGNIAVMNRATTIVNVNMQCVVGQGLDSGSVTVFGTTSNCPVWNTIVGNPENVTLDGGANVNDSGAVGATAIYPGTNPVPASIAVGQSLVLVGSASAPNPGLIAFSWSATGGTLSSFTGTNDPNSTDAGTTNQTTFTCPSTPATVTITMAVSDGPLPDGGSCDSRFTTGQITVNCGAVPTQCAFGTGCGDGGQICSADASCVPVLFSVLTLNVIDGGPDVIDNRGQSLPITIQTFNLSGPVGAPIALPTSGPGMMSIMGNFITEGDLTTSADGRYLSTIGWNTAPGGLTQTGSPVIARIDGAGHVDTSTMPSNAFAASAGGNPMSYRSAVSNDGSEFWISGSTSDTSGATSGIWFVPFGASTGVQLAPFPFDPTLPISARWLRIFNGQLYGGSDYTSPYVYSVGAGLPTSGAQAITELPGLPTAPPPLASPYGFLMFDLFPPAGPDTMYIADDGMNSDPNNGFTSNTGGANTGGGGITKWRLNGGVWSQVTTWVLTDGNFAADAGASLSGKPIGFRGLAGFATGSNVTLMATTGDNNGNPDAVVVVLQENGASTTAPTIGPGNVIANSGTRQVFRGVALTPQ